MTKRIKNKIITLLAVLCLIISAITVNQMVFASEQNGWYFSEVNINSSYNTGDTFVVPECDFILNGVSYDTAHYIVLPNKTSVIKNSLTLTESGNYKLVYTAKANGVSRSVAYDFSVLHSLYGIDGDANSVMPYYGSSDINGNAYSGQEGVFVRLKNMDLFYLKQILDISSYTKNDTLIKFFNIPQKPGENDANLILKLTDVQNEKNFVEIEFKTVLDDSNILTYYNTYITGRFTDSDVIGASLRAAQNASGEYKNYNGQWYSVQKNNAWGHETVFSWVGTPQTVQLGDEALSISYDYASNTIYANGMVVVDLDDPIFYEKGFSGFSSGKVKLSIEGKKFSKSYIDLCILQIADLDLSKNVFYDVDKPQIEIDYKGNENVPNAVVGEKYNIFGYSSTDEVDGACETDVFVYKNYYMDGKTIVDSYNGYFVPKTVGDYYIVYTSKDLSGNLAEEVVKVTAISQRSTPLSVSLEENALSVEAGSEVTAFSNVKVSGSIGNYEVSSYAVHNGTGKKFDITDGKFTPLYIGSYDVYVSATDYIGSVDYDVFSIEVTGDANGVIKFFDDYRTDKYYIKNATYTIDDYYAYKLTSSSMDKVLTKVYVNEDNTGFNKQVDGNNYLVKASKTVQFRYEYNGVYLDTDVYDVFDVNFGAQNTLNAEGFFSCENIDKTAKESGVLLTAVNGDTATKAEFINSVQVEEFSMLFTLMSDMKSFSKLNIKLTDTYDVNNFMVISYYLKGDTAYTSFNGKEVKLLKSYYGANVEYSLQFNNGTMTLNDEKMSFYNSEFKGFTDSLAYLSLSFEGVNGNAGVLISQINGQDFKLGMTDNRAPQIFVDKTSVSIPYNSEIQVRKAVVKDVIDPNPLFTFQVKTPNGSFAKTKDGVVLDGDNYSPAYVIIADMYGYYNFSYKAVDVNGNGQTRVDVKSFNYNSVDVTAPTLSVGEVSAKATVGSKISLPVISATDNTGSEVDVRIVLIDADGITSMLKEDSFVVSKVGQYTVVITATDDAGNYAYKQICINVG